MKKLFLIMFLFPLISLGQVQDTSYCYHGDTVVQYITTKFENKKQLFIIPDGPGLNFYQALRVYKDDSLVLNMPDSFKSQPWPVGLFKGTSYHRYAVYRPIQQKNGPPVILPDKPVIIGKTVVPNYFFLVSLVIGVLVLCLTYFVVISEYREYSKENKKLPAIRRILPMILGVVSIMSGIILACLISLIILKNPNYYPWSEIIVSFLIQIILLLFMFRWLYKKYLAEN